MTNSHKDNCLLPKDLARPLVDTRWTKDPDHEGDYLLKHQARVVGKVMQEKRGDAEVYRAWVAPGPESDEGLDYTALWEERGEASADVVDRVHARWGFDRRDPLPVSEPRVSLSETDFAAVMEIVATGATLGHYRHHRRAMLLRAAVPTAFVLVLVICMVRVGEAAQLPLMGTLALASIALFEWANVVSWLRAIHRASFRFARVDDELLDLVYKHLAGKYGLPGSSPDSNEKGSGS